jgi:hypothetical protein
MTGVKIGVKWKMYRALLFLSTNSINMLGGRTIGSTADSGSAYPGSSPGLPATLFESPVFLVNMQILLGNFKIPLRQLRTFAVP